MTSDKKKRNIHATIIRSQLIRISALLKEAQVATPEDRERRQTICLPAADLLDHAILQMDEKKVPGTNPAAARIQCGTALELLGDHADLETVFADLNDVVEERANYIR